MVYLIELAGCDEKRNLRFELKIGYTGDPEGKKRFDSYSFGNSGFKLLATISDGDLNDEQKIHNYFKKYRLVGRGREYYDYSYHDIFIKFFKDHPDHQSLLSVPVYLPKEYDFVGSMSSYLASNINKILISLSQFISINRIDKLFRAELCRFMELIREDNGRKDNTWEDIIDFCSIYLKISEDNLLVFTEKFNKLLEEEKLMLEKEKDNPLLTDFRIKYESLSTFDNQLMFLCQQIQEKTIELEEIRYFVDPLQYNAITLFGIERCKANKYRKGNIQNLITHYENQSIIKNRLSEYFEVGKRYTAKYIKNYIKELFFSLNINKSAKATVLKDYFEVKEVYITVDGKQQRGWLLLKRK